MEGRCQCATIKFTTPSPTPLKIYICHCTQCQHQTSSLFGVSAKFPAFEIPEPYPGAIKSYQGPSSTGKAKICLFCAKCGSRLTHGVEGGKTVSVKAGCLVDIKKLDFSKAEHIWVKEAVVKAWLPEGVKMWEEGPD